MTRILMVCLGNICRSPLAEGILASKLNSSEFNVDSAGTSSYHIGNAPDPRSIAVAKKHSINISNQQARQFVVSDFDNFDMIFAMDASNARNMNALARNADDAKKIKLILENADVPDPYYGGKDGFDHIYNLLDVACESIANQLISN